MTTSPRRSTRRTRSVLPDDRESAAGLVAGATTAVTLTVAFGLLALGVEDFWLAFVFGFGVVMPVALGVVGHRWPAADERDGQAATDQQTPLGQLRMRYARGELSEAEFEQRVDHLLESNREEESLVVTAPGRKQQ